MHPAAQCNVLVAYSDADFAVRCDLEISWSMTDDLVLINNRPIVRESGKQQSIALVMSAAETVEFIKVCIVTKLLRKMLFDLICCIICPQWKGEPTTAHM